MKYILTSCLFLFVSAATFAQTFPVDEESGKTTYEGVNEVSGVSADELFERALTWIDDFFPNPTAVIQSKSKEDGVIEGRARFRLNKEDKKGNQLNGGFVSYGFTLYFKDGRYKYVITDLRWEGQSAYDVSRWEDATEPHYDDINYPKYIEQTQKFIDDLLNSMKEGMEDSGEEAEDEW